MLSEAKMEFRALRGTSDLLAVETAQWTRLEQAMRAVCARFGFQEIRTPLMEDAQLFTRSVGDTTDIVQKEMYVFPDRGGRSIALRPEGTASLVRAYVEHELAKTEGLVKWFTIGPMFRAERPQAGRKRQFHQVSVEAIGASHPLLDAELVLLALALLEAAGVQGTRIRVNNVGCHADRERSSAQLREQLAPHVGALCEECRARIQRNVFRVIDCKHASCQVIVRQLQVAWSRCAACEAHHARVLTSLREAGVTYAEDSSVVRGLDYYTKTVFELSHEALGAQDALGAGGRYDNLVEALGGPDVGASGFALGIERVLMAAQPSSAVADASHTGAVAIAVLALDDAAQHEAFQLTQQLRSAGIAAAMDFAGRSLKAQMRTANKWGVKAALLLGAQERTQGTVTLKDMINSTQTTVPRAEVVTAVRSILT